MPMNPRLLRPTSSTLDRDAAVYLNAVAQADGQQLEPAVRKAINDFVIGCKRDGIWSAIKASCILAGARTLSGALVPLVGSAPTNNGPFVSGDYNRKTGLLGDGSTKFLNSNRNNNADPQDSQHLAVYLSSASSQACAYIGADLASTAGSSAIGRDAFVINMRSRHASTSGGTSAVTASSVGFFAKSRAASGSYSYRASGTAATFTVGSNSPTSSAIHVFVTSGGSAFSNGRHAFYSIGESLDLALLDTRVSALYTAIGAAIP